jgi:hypothetical protein
MDVGFLTTARYAEFASDGTITMIGASKDVHQTSTLPFVLPTLYIIARVVLTREEATVAHKLQFQIAAPDNDDFLVSEEIPVDRRQEIATVGEYLGVNSILALFNIPFAQDGRYHLRLLFDGVAVKALTFRVELQGALPLPLMPAQDQEN